MLFTIYILPGSGPIVAQTEKDKTPADALKASSRGFRVGMTGLEPGTSTVSW